jgi:hypothetical protein
MPVTSLNAQSAHLVAGVGDALERRYLRKVFFGFSRDREGKDLLEEVGAGCWVLAQGFAGCWVLAQGLAGCWVLGADTGSCCVLGLGGPYWVMGAGQRFCTGCCHWMHSVHCSSSTC